VICGLCREYRTRRSGELLGHLSGCAGRRWARVAELRSAGRDDEADGLVSRILGRKGPPMTAEARAALRAYEAGHREEINEKRRRRRVLRRVVARARKGGPR
jgi:hypothetical protein